VTDGELRQALLVGYTRAALLRDYCFGIKPGQRGIAWDPAYPYHRAPRECPFCGDVYRRHAGFADHRDECEDGPNPGANPVAPIGRGDES
jgi:hypothetical protein